LEISRWVERGALDLCQPGLIRCLLISRPKHERGGCGSLRDRPSRRTSHRRSGLRREVQVSIGNDRFLVYPSTLTQLKRSFAGTGWNSLARKGMVASDLTLTPTQQRGKRSRIGDVYICRRVKPLCKPELSSYAREVQERTNPKSCNSRSEYMIEREGDNKGMTNEPRRRKTWLPSWMFPGRTLQPCV